MSEEVRVGDRVKVTTVPFAEGVVEKIVWGYRTAVIRLDSGSTLSATLRELELLPVGETMKQ